MSKEREASASYRKALFTVTVLENPWVRHKPHLKQAEFLSLSHLREVLYGGAAGGGKSEALLMAALQFVDVPGYSAILFRRSYTDLSLPGALMSRAKEWLAGTGASWDGTTKTWAFPSGATLSFGYLDRGDDRYRYQSSEYAFIGFDELTQFPEDDYKYLFSRLRRNVQLRLGGEGVPLRMRAATNPGGPGHDWVRKRFGIRGRPKTAIVQDERAFVPARLDDNPSLDRVEYTAALGELDSFTRLQLLEGDWADFTGEYFRPEGWTRYLDIGDAYVLQEKGQARQVYPYKEVLKLVTVDWALSTKKTADFTAVGVFGVTPDNRLLVLDVVNQRVRLEESVPLLARVCKQWRPDVCAVEAHGFQMALLLECRKYPSIPEPRALQPGSAINAKLRRALPAVIFGENGRIHLPEEAGWLEDFVVQLSTFTGDDEGHDDMVDVLAYAARMANDLRGARGREEFYPEVFVAGKELF